MTLSNLLTEQAAASLAHKIVPAEHVKTLEPKAAELAGCTMFELMQRAGAAAFNLLQKKWPMAKRILVLAGHGNNAGDGYVLATLAKQQGLEVTVCCDDPQHQLSGDARQAKVIWQQANGTTLTFNEPDFKHYDLLVDALLGTGLKGLISESLSSLIQSINQSHCPILSLDLPSGMHANTGQPMPICVQASVTITFVAMKPGLVTGQGKFYCGQLTFADLDIGPSFFPLAVQAHCQSAQLVNYSSLLPLPARPTHAHKGAFGRVLCIGGNAGMAGAISLSAQAALRAGAGLVKVYCHAKSALSVSTTRPEIMLAEASLEQALQWSSCILIGPGLGQDDWAEQQLSRLIDYLSEQPKPVVIDADGLNLLAKRLTDNRVLAILANLPACIITPHPGEASRLLNCTIADIESDRYAASHSLSQRLNAVCVLKGAGSIICAPKTSDWPVSLVCTGGNPGMATAGMGDLLTGVAAALLGQNFSAQNAALYAVCMHAEAGDRVANQYGQRGMIASDLFCALRAIVNGR
ncbi:NAD(P)H-hydrate dehydratase [Paraglaciecola aestuariivivens]